MPVPSTLMNVAFICEFGPDRVLCAAEVREPTALHLRHDDVVDRQAAGRPDGIEGVVHLVQSVRHLPRRAIDQARRRPRAGLAPGVPSLDVEFDDLAVRLGRNPTAEHAIGRPVPVQAIVEHRHAEIAGGVELRVGVLVDVGGRVEAIAQRHSQAGRLFVEDPCGDGDGIRRPRDDRPVSNVQDQRGDVAYRDRNWPFRASRHRAGRRPSSGRTRSAGPH